MWGRYEHSLDDKGRVIVPQKFRDKLGDEFVLTTGPDHHVRIYPMAAWETLEQELGGSSIHDEQNASLNFLQRMFGNCEFASADQQNRLSIPRHMRSWAELHDGDNVVILGSGTRLELWNRTRWDNFSSTFTAQNAARASSALRTGQNISETDAPVDLAFGVVETRGNSVPT